MDLPEWAAETEVVYDMLFRFEGEWRVHGWTDIPDLESALKLMTDYSKDGTACKLIEKTITKKVLDW